MLQIQQHVSEKFYVMINYQDDTEIRRLVRHRIFQIQSGHQAKTKRLVLQNRCTVTRSITEDHVSGIFLHDYFDVYMPSDFIGMDAEIQEILGEVLMEITIEDHPFGFVARLEVTIPDESSPITFQSTVKASPKLARDSLLCVIHQHLVSKGTIYGGNQGLVKSTPMDMAASDEDFSCSDMLYSRQTPACLHYSLWPNETPLMLHVLYLQPLEATSRRSFAMLTPAPIHSSDLCELPVEAFSIPYSSSVEGIDITHIQFELLMRFQAKLWSILNLSSLRSETPSKAYLVSPTKRTEDKWYIDWKFTAAFCNEEPEELKTAETVIERLCANPESATLPFEEFYDILKPGAVPDLTKFSNAKGVIDSTLKSLILKSTRKSMLYECFGVEETLTLDSTFVAPRIQEDPISYRHYFTNMGYKFDDSHPILLKVRALKAEGFEAHSRDEPVSFSYHLASSCTVQPFSRDWLYLASQLPLSLSTLEQHLSLLEFRKSVNLERISLWKLLECFTTPITRQEPNYERLEFLGDSFIKFATTFSLWTDHPGLCEGNLSQLRARKVCNQNLYRLGSELGLGNYLLVNSLRSKSWIPPFRQGKVVLSLLTVKTIADCFEAFVGALFLDAGVQACFSFLARLGLVSQASIDRLYDVVHGITFPPGLNLDEYVEIEQSLGYSFEDPNLLWISLCKSNSDGRGTETLDRLEFLGDAVLELCVTIYLFRKYPDKPPGQLTDIRQSIVNNKNFARLANKHGLLVLSKDCIANRSRESLGKFASDIWEAVAGAVFVDTNFDLENFWQVYEPLLASERSSLSVGPNHQNPSRLLNEISQRRENRGKDLEFSYVVHEYP